MGNCGEVVAKKFPAISRKPYDNSQMHRLSVVYPIELNQPYASGDPTAAERPGHSANQFRLPHRVQEQAQVNLENNRRYRADRFLKKRSKYNT